MAANYWRRRITRHLQLALLSALIVAAVFLLTPPPDARHRLSMGTAYAATALLAWTLALGPWNLLRGRPNPVSFDLRRDAGIWAGLLALLHTAVGLTVHLHGRMWMYFFRKLHPLHLQAGEFGWANWLGAGSALLMALLLIISNDLSLRGLGLARWKLLQRTAYIAAALALAHGILFQLLEKRALPWIILFASFAGVILATQWLGVARRWRAGNPLPAGAARKLGPL